MWVILPSAGKNNGYTPFFVDNPEVGLSYDKATKEAHKLNSVGTALKEISGIISEAWGDYDGPDESFPNGVLPIFNVFHDLDYRIPDWPDSFST